MKTILRAALIFLLAVGLTYAIQLTMWSGLRVTFTEQEKAIITLLCVIISRNILIDEFPSLGGGKK